MSTKELQEKIIANMRKWQKIEDVAVMQMSEIVSKTKNPFIRMVMEIIRQDSQNHHRVQELIANTLESQAITFSPDELGAIWELVENHIRTEKEVQRMAEENLELLQGKKMVVQEYLLNYLLVDEQKHVNLLENMELMKKGMYPYG